MKPTSPRPRLVGPNRDQLIMAAIDVEKLIPSDHPARAIWEFVSRLDLTKYESNVKSVEGAAGRPAYDPRLLVSLWIYAYSDGEHSAREIERLCAHHPAYRWLTGMEKISCHTLSDFRVGHKEELDELFTQVIGLLTAENLITLHRVTHDGMKVKAYASSKSFRGEKTLKDHLKQAREHVEKMEDARREVDGTKRERARERVLRERKERLEKALDEFEKIGAAKGSKSRKDRKEVRVSESDPEARIMKHNGGGFAPGYNLQISTDSENSIVVNVSVSQAAGDMKELLPAMENVRKRTNKNPEQVVADAGYTGRENIMSMEKMGIDFFGSFPDNSASVDARYKQRGVERQYRGDAFVYDESADKYICPAGKELSFAGKIDRRAGVSSFRYRTRSGVCATCPNNRSCCPQTFERGREIIRSVEVPEVVAYHEKMKSEEARAVYKTRSATAEFPHAWIKEKFGLRQFRLRGKEKTEQESLWACLTYNIQQWIRLVWRPQLVANTG